MIELLQLDRAYLTEGTQYAVSYRPVQQNNTAQLEVWHEPLSVGRPLPIMPLPLDKSQTVRLDIEETYQQACRRMRLPS